MDPLSVTASAAGIISLGIQATKSLVDYYSAYKSQKSDVAGVVKKLELLLGLLQISRKQLDERIFRAGDQDLLDKIESSIQFCNECVDELQFGSKKFGGETDTARRPIGGKRSFAQTAAYRLIYPLRQSTLQKLNENVEEVVSHLSLALQLLQAKDIGNIQDDVEDTKALLDLVRADQIEGKTREWLKAPDATINFNDACKKRHSGTGLWLTGGSSFALWLAEPNSLLWLKGFAGCGKSVLCSTVIQHVARHRRSSRRIGIAFFFFTFNDLADWAIRLAPRAPELVI